MYICCWNEKQKKQYDIKNKK